MIGIREALERCLASVPPVETEVIPVIEARGRVLAEDVVACTPIPPWDNSAMDGYAIQSHETQNISGSNNVNDACSGTVHTTHSGVRFPVVETIAAGAVGTHTVNQGEAVRIMTGAPIPAGVDAVVMREQTTESDDYVVVHKRVESGDNIRRRGEDVPAGTVVLETGTVLSPSAMGLCAAVGRATISVSRRPNVAIISTGDELVSPGSPLGPGQIHSSNTHALAGLIQDAGGLPVDCGLVADDLGSTREAFVRATACDLIISTGGVSVGDYDLVRQAMRDLGANMNFWKVRIKPGKPLAYGVIHNTPTFGLPGNPVSCQVGFLQFVRPWIRLALGDPKPYLPVIRAKLRDEYTKKAGRAELCRVILQWDGNHWLASLAGKQSSGSQTSMVVANGLMLLSEDAYHLHAGDHVNVQVMENVLLPNAAPEYPWS